MLAGAPQYPIFVTESMTPLIMTLSLPDLGFCHPRVICYATYAGRAMPTF